MQKKYIAALLLATALAGPSWAEDAFDLGGVEVVGKDAQSAKIEAIQHKLEFDMGDRKSAMPEIMPPESDISFRPITEKSTFENFHKENKNEYFVAAGLGSQGSKELLLNGHGTKKGYTGEFSLISEKKDGFYSNVDSSITSLKAHVGRLNTNYNGAAEAEYTSSEYALRSRRDTVYNPNAGLKNSIFRLRAFGDSTDKNGGFVKASLSLNSLERDLTNASAAGETDQSIFAVSASASYIRKLGSRVRGRAEIELKNDKLEQRSSDVDFTKTLVGVGAEYEMSTKATAAAGIKNINMKNKHKTVPFASFDYRFSEPWQLVLSYSEDLKNDDLEELYMPAHFVEQSGIRPSRQKNMKGSLNYKTQEGNTIGVDVFSQEENDAAEYIDVFSLKKQALESQINYAGKAKRKGSSIHGSFKVEDCLFVNLKGTFQTAKDDTDGHKLSYEPKKILEAGFNFKKNKLMLDFSRRAEYDRSTRIRNDFAGALPFSVDAEDYSRSDLVIKYKFNDQYGAYVKVKDLYDEAKELRYNVQEEGRVTLAGLEAHF